MKKSSPGFFGVLLLSGLLLAGSLRAGALQDGDIAANKGDFTAAARDYQTALSAGPVSAGLYDALATVQFKAGQPADAALNFRRALMLDPRLADAAAALSALERAQGVVSVPPDWRATLAQRFDLSVFVIAGSILFWIAAFLLVARLFLSSPRKFPFFSTLLLVAGLALFLVGALADPRLADRHTGVIVSDKEVPLLSAPADQSDSLATLPPASCVQIVRRSGAWTYCQAASGQKGWVPSPALQSVVPST